MTRLEEAVKRGYYTVELEEKESEIQQLRAALEAFFSEYDSDSEYSHCAPTDETEAKMREALNDL
jgi:hypothetical protein